MKCYRNAINALPTPHFHRCNELWKSMDGSKAKCIFLIFFCFSTLLHTAVEQFEIFPSILHNSFPSRFTKNFNFLLQIISLHCSENISWPEKSLNCQKVATAQSANEFGINDAGRSAVAEIGLVKIRNKISLGPAASPQMPTIETNFMTISLADNRGWFDARPHARDSIRYRR